MLTDSHQRLLDLQQIQAKEKVVLTRIDEYTFIELFALFRDKQEFFDELYEKAKKGELVLQDGSQN